MIDRLELIVPEGTIKIPGFWETRRSKPAKAGSPYQFTIDIRYDLALSIHFGHRTPISHTKGHYKLDFTDTRLMSAHDFLWRICSIFQLTYEQALLLKVARIDLAADVAGTPVEWFREHCRVLKKRGSKSYESMETETKRAVTTITFGKRPDLYRIYNRIAEKRSRKEEILYPGMFFGAPVPVITRIERQCSGRKMPPQLGTLGKVFDNAEDFDPFQNLILSSGGEMPATDDWAPQRWLMNLGLACAVNQFGIAAVRSRLNQSKNAQRIFSKYSELLLAGAEGPTRTRPLRRAVSASLAFTKSLRGRALLAFVRRTQMVIGLNAPRTACWRGPFCMKRIISMAFYLSLPY